MYTCSEIDGNVNTYLLRQILIDIRNKYNYRGKRTFVVVLIEHFYLNGQHRCSVLKMLMRTEPNIRAYP